MPSARHRSRCVFYLVAVYGVLRRPGGYGDGVWLAAAVALAVSVFTSLPEQTRNITILILSLVLTLF